MQEVFYEESAKVQNEKSCTVKYNLFKTFSILSYVALAIWVMVVFIGYDFGKGNLVLNIIFVLVPVAMFIASGIILGRFKNRFYVDYDYTFVTGSIRVSKVIKNIKRKFLIKFETSDIEKIGKYDSETFNKYFTMPGISKMFLTSNSTASEDKDFYYIVANVDGDKKLMIFECSELFIVNILKFSNKSVLEEEFYKK